MCATAARQPSLRWSPSTKIIEGLWKNARSILACVKNLAKSGFLFDAEKDLLITLVLETHTFLRNLAEATDHAESDLFVSRKPNELWDSCCRTAMAKIRANNWDVSVARETRLPSNASSERNLVAIRKMWSVVNEHLRGSTDSRSPLFFYCPATRSESYVIKSSGNR